MRRCLNGNQVAVIKVTLLMAMKIVIVVKAKTRTAVTKYFVKDGGERCKDAHRQLG